MQNLFSYFLKQKKILFILLRIKHNKSNLYSAKANLDTIENAVKNQLSKRNLFIPHEK